MAKGKRIVSLKARRGRSFMTDSPWSRVSEETRQGWGLRKSLIEELEKQIGGMVVLYFTSFSDEKVVISDQDAEMIENMLSVEAAEQESSSQDAEIADGLAAVRDELKRNEQKR